MSQIDDKINSLSSDELDLLNSDPKLLSDFKTKYSTPPTPTESVLGAVGSTLKSSLLPNPETALKPLSGDTGEMLGQALSPTEGLTRVGQTLREPSIAAGEKVEQFGKDINAPMTGKIGGFMAQTALDPLTYAGMSLKLPENVAKEVPNLLEKATSIPAKATELEGYNLPTPKPEEIDKGIENIQKMVKQVWKEHGDILNKAKTEAGIPSNEDAVATSVRKYGNAANLDVNKPLEMPEHFSKNAPAMEEPPIRPLEKGDVVTLKSTNPSLPDVQAMHNGPPTVPGNVSFQLKGSAIPETDPERLAMNAEMNKKYPDLPQVTNPVRHGPESDVSSGDLEKYGYKIPEGITPPEYQAPKSPMAMPYKIGMHDTPEQLMTEINRFKSNLPYISQKDQIKAAHYFQDQITQQGVFQQDKAKGLVMGTLKSQYGDLSDVMQTASPELKAAKSKMAGLYDTMDEINKKLSGGKGEAEGYLRKLFTSKDPQYKDDLKALAHIEKLSGKPVVQELFKKFAGEAYGQMLGQSVHTIFQAPYAALTSPSLILTPAGKLGPSLSKLGKFTGSGMAERGLQQPFNTPEMQSIRDRLHNAE